MSQINTNTIANELGTGGPDFVGMPSVAGDPVVQSGSNTDGEWTRWADGTQQCHINTIIPSNDNAGTSFPYPSPFLQTPAGFGVHRGIVSSSAAASYVTETKTYQISWSAKVLVHSSSSISAPTDTPVSLFATGRWK